MNPKPSQSPRVPIRKVAAPAASLDTVPDIIAAAVAAQHPEYYAGRNDGFRGILFLLLECKTPGQRFLRSEMLGDYLAGSAVDVGQLARKCGVTKRTIFSERRRILDFIKFSELS